MKRRPRRATQPAKRIDWSKVDLTRDPQELVEELGCARQAVYHARRRYLDRTPRAPLGKGWRRRSALIVASPFCTSVVGRRLLRLVEAGDAERTMIGRESWYRPVTDAGRDAFRRLLAGEASPTFDVPDGYDISKPPQVVADELGCSLSTARRLRKRAGVGLGRRIDWDRVDLTRDVHDLTAELGVGADSVYSQRRKRGVTVRPARPDGDGWYSIAELHQASDKAHVTIQRRAIQMARGGDLDVVKAGVRKFYRPATPTGREWLRDLFDSRPRVARESVREAADGVLDMLVKAGAVERRGSTNDTVWRVNDAEAVRRAGLQVEQRGGLS